MTDFTIHDIDEEKMNRLRARAARHGRSIEDEAHEILRSALEKDGTPQTEGLGAAIRRRFAPFGGVELDIPPRGPGREPPDFSE